MSENNRMTQPFDLHAEYEAEVAQHIQAAWEGCKRLNIPCILAVCHTNAPYENGTGTSLGMAKAVNFIGQDRTPASFVVADIAIEESPRMAAMAVLMKGLGANEGIAEAGDTVEVAM